MTVVSPRIVYTPRYKVGLAGLERYHPFDLRKSSRAAVEIELTIGQRFRDALAKPSHEVSFEQLLHFHSKTYLQELHDREYLAGVFAVPQIAFLPYWTIDRFILQPMRWVVAGTILGAKLAIKHGLAINLGGGYHHASQDRGEGFCVYNDIALAVDDLRRDECLSEDDRIAYIDLDVHQGNGVCRAFARDSRVFIYDQYNAQTYPMRDREARGRIDCDVPLEPGCDDDCYLTTLTQRLPPFLDSIRRSHPVRLAIYNAGTDVLAGDSIGQFKLSSAGVLHRDQFVLEQLVKRNIPTLMLPSGGYSKESYRLIAATVIWVLDRWGQQGRLP